MIEIRKGKYKNLSMKIDDNLSIIVKAPNRIGDEKIVEFINKHKNWIKTHQERILNLKEKLKEYDFKNNVYIFDNPTCCINKNKFEIYKQLFSEIISDLVEKLSYETSISYNSLKSINSKRVWGSMDKNKNMRLNLKIILLPKEIVEYIIIHELCHTIYFNHSKQFWNQVNNFCPNFKECNKKLKEYSFLLRENIFS